MIKFLYNSRLYLPILVVVFAAQGAVSIYQHHVVPGEVLVVLALLVLVLLFYVVKRKEGTFFNRTAAILIIAIISGFLADIAIVSLINKLFP